MHHPGVGWAWKNLCSSSLVQGSKLKQASSETSRSFASFPEEGREVFAACPEQARGDIGVVPGCSKNETILSFHSDSLSQPRDVCFENKAQRRPWQGQKLD